ncbi:hypothetical protein ACHAWF_004920 [Thalassiosira exigua]
MPPDRGLADDRRPVRTSSSAYASKFALYGAVGSLLSLAVLAALCSVVVEDGGPPWDAPPGDAPTSVGGRGRRRVEELRPTEESEWEEGGDDGLRLPPCGDVFQSVRRRSPSEPSDDDYDRRACSYARNCDGALPSRTLLPLVLCHGVDENDDATSNDDGSSGLRYRLEWIFIYLLLPPLLSTYLLLLFRLLATTAESYFSPALESFSFELGLPPRFAGATLLALGNGSPDLGSTVNAVLLWHEDSAADDFEDGNEGEPTGAAGVEGGSSDSSRLAWTMSVGSLAGGGMFVGCVVLGALVRECGGIPCRGALLRDVAMYASSICAVWYVLGTGKVEAGDAHAFLWAYAAYVTLVLCADVYHRKVTLKRLQEEGRMRRRSLDAKRSSKLSELAREELEEDASEPRETTPLIDDGDRRAGGWHQQLEELQVRTKGGDASDSSSSSSDDQITTPSGRRVPRHGRLSTTDRFAMFMSNYDPRSVKFDAYDTLSSRSGSSDFGSIAAALRGAMPGIHEPPRDASDESGDGEAEEQRSEQRSARAPLERVSELLESSVFDEVEGEARSWSWDLFADAYDELAYRHRRFVRGCFREEASWLGKAGALLELPFVAVRTITIPVPCEEHYVRPILALSVAISPFWVVWYLDATLPVGAYGLISVVVALAILRYGNDEKLPLAASVRFPISPFLVRFPRVSGLTARASSSLPRRTNAKGSDISLRLLHRGELDRHHCGRPCRTSAVSRDHRQDSRHDFGHHRFVLGDPCFSSYLPNRLLTCDFDRRSACLGQQHGRSICQPCHGTQRHARYGHDGMLCG